MSLDATMKNHVRHGYIPETGWKAAKDIRSAKVGTKASKQSASISLSAQLTEFFTRVCKGSSLES